MGLPSSSVVKNLPAMQEMWSDPGSGRSPGEGNGNPLQYSCLENPHGWRRLVGCSPGGSKKLDMTEVTKQYNMTGVLMRRGD